MSRILQRGIDLLDERQWQPDLGRRVELLWIRATLSNDGCTTQRKGVFCGPEWAGGGKQARRRKAREGLLVNLPLACLGVRSSNALKQMTVHYVGMPRHAAAWFAVDVEASQRSDVRDGTSAVHPLQQLAGILL